MSYIMITIMCSLMVSDHSIVAEVLWPQHGVHDLWHDEYHYGFLVCSLRG